MKRLMPALFLMALTGCVYRTQSHFSHNQTRHSTVGSHQWAQDERLELSYRVDGSDAILDSDRVMIVFQNLSDGERNAFSFQQGKVWIQIAGEGVSTVSVNCQSNRDKSNFLSRYENGTNTIQFCGREVRLANQGRLITTRNQIVDASVGKRQITVISAEQ